MTNKMPEYNTLDYLKDDIEMQREYISELLNEYLTDNNADAFLSALKPLIQLNGSISEFAKKSGINRTYFYKLFKKEVKPEFPTIVLIIKNLGFNINFNLNCLK
jgi:probable addiction module antidote protein